jgi:hypothetical protein
MNKYFHFDMLSRGEKDKFLKRIIYRMYLRQLLYFLLNSAEHAAISKKLVEAFKVAADGL